MRLLVVDDDDITLELTSAMMRRRGLKPPAEAAMTTTQPGFADRTVRVNGRNSGKIWDRRSGGRAASRRVRIGG